MANLKNGYTVSERYVRHLGVWIVEVRNKENIVTSSEFLPNETEAMSLVDYIKEEFLED